MATTLAISGQHYLFTIQALSRTILALGGDEFTYAMRDRTTRGVIEDVQSGKSELGVIVETEANAEALNEALAAHDLAFVEVAQSAPCIALPASHPMSSAKKLTLDDMADYPYLCFEQEDDAPDAFYEEAHSDVKHARTIYMTDRASLSELMVALNGFTVTSGILVGITDAGSLSTVPLDTDEVLHLGYIKKAAASLSVPAERFVGALSRQLERYATPVEGTTD